MPGFGKEVRLLTPAAFDAAFKSGKRFAVGPLMAVVAPNSLGYPRLGFALAKRHAKTAVQRNRIRRALREQFRLAQAQLAAVDLVISLKSNPTDDRTVESVAVQQFWQKLAARCRKP